jgi:hypothetical protein
MPGVVKDVPVPRLDPPVLAAYQFKVPALAAAPKTTVPVPQRLPGVVEVIDGVEFTVADTNVLAEVQPPFVASTK